MICNNVKSILDVCMILSNGIARAADMLHNVTKSISEFVGGIIKGRNAHKSKLVVDLDLLIAPSSRVVKSNCVSHVVLLECSMRCC